MNVVVRQQAEALARLGHSVEILTRRDDPATPERQEMVPGVTVCQVDAGPAAKITKGETDRWIEEFSAGMRRFGPYRLVHSHHWMSGLAAAPVAREWGVPHLVSYHSIAAPNGWALGHGEPPESANRVAGEAQLARECDLLIAISRAEAATIVHRCGADPARVRVLSPGVDSQMFRPLRPGEPRWSGAGGPYVMFAARLQPLKGADLAIAAMGHVRPRHRVKLLIAGDVSDEYADYRADIEAQVHELGIADDVVYVGSQDRDELAWTMRSSQMMLVPSHSETFGLIALEGAASGVPVIAAAGAGGLRESVAHGHSGVLLDDRDPENWGRLITELLDQPAEIARLGRGARQWALMFSWPLVVERLVELYEEVLAR